MSHMSDIIEMLKDYLGENAQHMPAELINVLVTGDYAEKKQTMLSTIDLVLVFKGELFGEDEKQMKDMLGDFCEYPEMTITCVSNKGEGKKMKQGGVVLWKK